jgi:hypothetical protein
MREHPKPMGIRVADPQWFLPIVGHRCLSPL